MASDEQNTVTNSNNSMRAAGLWPKRSTRLNSSNPHNDLVEEARLSLFYKHENREMKKFVSGHTAYRWSWDSGSKIYILTCYTCPRKGGWPLTLKELREV